MSNALSKICSYINIWPRNAISIWSCNCLKWKRYLKLPLLKKLNLLKEQGSRVVTVVDTVVVVVKHWARFWIFRETLEQNNQGYSTIGCAIWAKFHFSLADSALLGRRFLAGKQKHQLGLWDCSDWFISWSWEYLCSAERQQSFSKALKILWVWSSKLILENPTKLI